MLKSREMWLVMLCWRPRDQGLYCARTKLHFFLFLMLLLLKIDINTLDTEVEYGAKTG